MSNINEGRTVQGPLIDYAVQAGWQRLEPYDCAAMRCGQQGLVLERVLLNQLQRLNPGYMTEALARECLRLYSIEVTPNVEGSLAAWRWLCGQRSVYVPAERRALNVRLLDTERPEANVYHVTPELSFTSGTQTIRPDVGFFINGLPVLVLEAKNPTRTDALDQAYAQLRRYHREGPELMAAAQLQALANLLHFRYAATWVLSSKYFFDWKQEGRAGDDFETLVKGFISPSRMLRVLSRYILYTRSDEQLSKVVLRPHQMRAVDRVLERVLDRDRPRGLVWHTQGSGKTYTMMTAARQLVTDDRFGKPTVILLVDRTELQDQLRTNMEAAGLDAEVAGSKREMRRLLQRDYRGIIIAMIHKFDGMPVDSNASRNVVVLVDEAHRSTGGDLGNYMMGALPNATYIGFTGTPIDRTAYGKGTFKVFGGQDSRGYLDKYSIAESVADGTTVPLHYGLAPGDLRVDRDVLDREFLRLTEAYGVSDPKVLDEILRRSVNLGSMLKSPARIEQTAQHIAQHFRDNVRPMGLKAMVVGVDRQACARYKEALDRYLPPEWSRVVYSAAHNDGPELAQYHMSQQEEMQARKCFRKADDELQILIVTDKLLTGFDAPVLYCMYLDKPMRDHVLLQAIARVNRPYDAGHKSAGLIYDLVGVFENLEKALAFDSKDVTGIIEGLDALKERFVALMAQGCDQYLGIGAGLRADKYAEAVLEHFRDEPRRSEFYEFWKELESAYEILSPDAFLSPYIADYGDLARIYQMVRAAFSERISLDPELLHKTQALVGDSVEAGPIMSPEHLQQVTGELLQGLLRGDVSDTVKVFNLTRAIEALVQQKGGDEPYLVPIGERALEIIRRFEERQLTSAQALEELIRLVQELQEAESSREETRLSADAFAVYWMLEHDDIPDAEGVASSMERVFAENPHWKSVSTQENEINRVLALALTKRDAAKVSGTSVWEIARRVLDVLRRRE